MGVYSSNHASSAAAYWQLLLDWTAPAQALGQQYAQTYGITCAPNMLHYACHLAPWGYQSFDTTVYMHWNGHFSAMLFINNWEYTLNATFARDVIYPLLDGHNAWWACSLNKTGTGSNYTYHDSRSDAEHEGQLVTDPQIALAFAARTVSAQLDIAEALGLPAPPILLDIASHLAPFNTAQWNYTVSPSNASFTIYPDSRLAGDSGFIDGSTLAECEAACASRPYAQCALFTFCPNRSVTGCDVGPSCWQYTADKLPSLHANPGFTSGARAPPPNGSLETLTVWSAFAGASASKSDLFAAYPLWPTEFAVSGGAPLTPALADIAQASARAYVSWADGRSVDVFATAVLAGLGYVFPKSVGGSVVTHGPTAPPYAFSPAEILAGFRTQIGRLFGGNLLIYAPGGGIES